MPLNSWGVDSLFVVKLFTEIRELKVKILSFTFYLSYNLNQDRKDIWDWGEEFSPLPPAPYPSASSPSPIPNPKLDLGETVPFR